jgi:hypothetical protein
MEKVFIGRSSGTIWSSSDMRSETTHYRRATVVPFEGGGHTEE